MMIDMDSPNRYYTPGNFHGKSYYFTNQEFHNLCPPCDISDMQFGVIYFLDDLRAYMGKPVLVTSAYRTKEWELSKGRSGTSSHCKGLAVDIACPDDVYRLKVLYFLFRNPLVCNRVGIGKNFIHVDFDTSKKPAVWVY